jgi:hypothetical protein
MLASVHIADLGPRRALPLVAKSRSRLDGRNPLHEAWLSSV